MTARANWNMETTPDHYRPVPTLTQEERVELAIGMCQPTISHRVRDLYDRLRYRVDSERDLP